jgi:hypothetical protein
MEGYMPGEDKSVTLKEVGAFGVGFLVTVTSTLITSLVTPVPFPFNFLISFALGGTATYGALKVLDPDTDHDRLEKQTNAEFRLILQEIADIAERIADLSSSSRVGPEASDQVGSIARMAEMILKRYQERPRDFVGASSTLLILQKFDEILTHYLKIKCGDLFLDEASKEREIAETETRMLPMFVKALENLGKKLDSGETIGKEISKGTLESMLKSLNLLEFLNDQLDSSSPKMGDPR